MADDLNLSMGIVAEDHASAAIKAVQQSLAELVKQARTFNSSLKNSLGSDLSKGLTDATAAASKFGTQLKEAAEKAATALKADATAATSIKTALAEAVGEANKLSAASKASVNSMQASARAAAYHARTSSTMQTRATRDRIRDIGTV